MQALLFFSQTLLAWAVRNTKKVAAIAAFVFWIIGFIEVAIVGVVKAIVLLIQSIDTTGLGNVDLSTAEWIGYFNSVLPLTEMIGLLILYFSLLTTIYTIRWIKSFVPTIAN